MDNDQATEYLGSMLGKQLRIYTADTRMFVGDFRCTDNVRPDTLNSPTTSELNANPGQECNIILGQSFEYRLPTQKALDTASASLSTASLKLDMTSRFLGLIVVPGQHIVKIEIEESRETRP